jgi:hypothetical protein
VVRATDSYMMAAIAETKADLAEKMSHNLARL